MKMEPKYIQLPPIPSDMPTEFVEIVWGFARMEEPEREKFLDFVREKVGPDAIGNDKEKLLRMMEESGGKASSYVEEFNSLMQKLVVTLLAQACEMSALVYRHYCVEEKSIKEISEIVHVPEDSIEAMAQYYERKMK